MSKELPPRTCPKCGATSTGKFCHACGAQARAQTCPKCKVEITAGAQFCHGCGTPVGAAPPANTSSRLPWVIAGSAVVISILVFAVRTGPTNSQPSNSAPATRSSVGAPDISSMTPREQANGLFNVVMMALESGDTAQVGFHAPMALGAYANLDSLDGDAQYHVGLLRGAVGDLDGMLAMADSLHANVPDHLLATALRKAVAEARGDSAGVLDAYRKFLNDYSDEATVNRQEYLHHRRSIDAFLEEARRATAGEGN